MPTVRVTPSGTRLMLSTPPATTTSIAPHMTACAAKSRACWLEPQARLTVVPGMLGGQHREPRDVAGLVADLGHAAPDDVVHEGGVQPGAARDLGEHQRRQVDRMHSGQPAAALADRRAHGLHDYRITHRCLLRSALHPRRCPARAPEPRTGAGSAASRPWWR